MLINYGWRQNTQIGQSGEIGPTQAAQRRNPGMGQDSGRCIRIGVILIWDSFTATNVTTLGVMTTLAKLTHQKNIVYFIPRGIKFAPTLYFKLDDAE